MSNNTSGPASGFDETDQKLRARGRIWRDEQPADRPLAEYLPAEPTRASSKRLRRPPSWALIAAVVVMIAGGVAVPIAVSRPDQQSSTPPVPSTGGLPRPSVSSSAVPPTSDAPSSAGVTGPAGTATAQTSRPAAAKCPTTVPAPGNDLPPALSVPARPSVPSDRMVPDTTPVAAVVCSYAFRFDQTSNPKVATVELRGNLAGIAEELRWLPPQVNGQSRGCRAMGGPTTVYLLGLTYESGDVWISSDVDPNACSGTTNGRFASVFGIGTRLQMAAQLKSWPKPEQQRQSVSGCSGTGARYGQQDAMVPDGALSVTICASVTASKPLTTSERVGELTARLNAAQPRASTSSCQPVQDQRRAGTYSLEFRYPDGPPVSVRLNSGCTPSADNGSLAADVPLSVESILESLLENK